MFEGLSEKLSGILDKLTRRGALSEEDVNAALREVRRALLEADVALEVRGQRPTALCALGRKGVWTFFSLAPLLRGEVQKGQRHCSTICRNGLVAFSIV